jgi:hypothetical protein
MRPCNLKNRLINLSAITLFMALPVMAVGQQENRAQATPTPTPTPRPSPSPESGRPAGTPGEDEARPRDPMSSPTFNGLRFRSLGPAFTSGRVIGFAVDPNNASKYFVASASGGVWRTINNGNTWTPVFDREGSYSIGAIFWIRKIL